LPALPGTPAQVFEGRPKLIVIVVIDQFRGDYLNRDAINSRAAASISS